MVARRQLTAFGYTEKAIRHRLRNGRLHRVFPGVYAVGRPELSREGVWMAAVLTCGDGAVLSHESAALLWGILRREPRTIHISVPAPSKPVREGIEVHRRSVLDERRDVTTHKGIPVTTITTTLVDIAPAKSRFELEAAINEADILQLTTPPRLRNELPAYRGYPGVAILCATLDYHAFRLQRSDLERLFLRIVKASGLPLPETRTYVNGFEVDFYWPELGVVVEADSLTYHRTAAKQARDYLRDQTHTVAGLVTLRFSHAQIAFEARYVERTLKAVIAPRFASNRGTR